MLNLLKRFGNWFIPPKDMVLIDAAIGKAEEALGITPDDQKVIDTMYLDAIVTISNQRLIDNDILTAKVAKLEADLAKSTLTNIALCDDLIKSQNHNGVLTTQNQAQFEQILDLNDTIDVLRTETSDLIGRIKKPVKKSKT